jgi:hypothetical protein
MFNIELKLIFDSESKNFATDAVIWIESILNAPLQYRTFTVNPSAAEELRTCLPEKYDLNLREGVSDGCFGARTGKSFEGLTLWMHAASLVDRYIDSDYGEQVNPWDLLEENGQRVESFESEEEIERFCENAEALGLRVVSDNTYNYATDYGGENSDCAGFMYDFQFDLIENESKGKSCVFLCVMFHCGGDPRGNYTSKKVWKFDSIDDVCSVLHPSKMLSSDNE